MRGFHVGACYGQQREDYCGFHLAWLCLLAQRYVIRDKLPSFFLTSDVDCMIIIRFCV